MVVEFFSSKNMHPGLWFSTQDSTSVALDSSKTSIVSFTEDLSQIYTDDAFKYPVEEVVNQNFLERAINWLFRSLQDLFGINLPPGIQKLVTSFIYILLIAAAIYFIVTLLVGKEAVSFFKKKEVSVQPLVFNEEDIDQLDLDNLLNEALSDKNYRLAIRFLYLKTLQQLSLKNRIQFHAEKTNKDYVSEIENIQVKNIFKKISYAYEYIWYGEFEIDQNGFELAQSSFEQLKRITG
ncbi:hypothetical protein NBT05_15470 [Aquimarina sp. ERC-38]|uniref:hypothetical protein n=1 Tax=Aquimarina sp. ERC-38 TaxID=2949996 RepID=UPI002246A0C7|nr:hypothetical protein [Aquimarina sp. ERC-38]UZO80342.1 hypothetical protein NBT05_15470 [Aquimarina sp. ERC-38]